MENNKIANIKKASKATETVLKIFESLCGAVAIICLVVVIVIACNKAKINSEAVSNNISIENFSFAEKMEFGIFSFDTHYVERYLAEGNLAGLAMFCLGFGALACVLATAFFECVRIIFAALQKSDTPFTKDILRKIKIYGIIIAAGLLAVGQLGMCLVVVLAGWSLYCVFDYGCELQKESDETL